MSEEMKGGSQVRESTEREREGRGGGWGIEIGMRKEGNEGGKEAGRGQGNR